MQAREIVAAAVVLLVGCGSGAPLAEPPPTATTTSALEVSGGSSASCAAQDPEVVDGLVASAAAGGFSVVVATVEEVEPALELEVDGYSFGPIYTPLRLAGARVLGGATDALSDVVFAPGGTIGEVNQNGVMPPAPGSRVLLELNTGRTDEWAPDGPEVSNAYPVLADGRVVVVAEGCLSVTDDTPSGTRAEVSYEVLDIAGAVQTVRGEQGLVPLAEVESALAGR